MGHPPLAVALALWGSDTLQFQQFDGTAERDLDALAESSLMECAKVSSGDERSVI